MDEANNRSAFGHFEADLIVSCKGSKSALLVLVDRMTRRTKIKKLEREKGFPYQFFDCSRIERIQHLITYDNGCKFSRNENVNKVLQCKSYFCNQIYLCYYKYVDL